MKKSIRVWSFAGMALLSAGCGGSKASPPELDPAQIDQLTFGPATEFHEKSAVVKVSLAVARLDDGWVVIRGVFDPNQEGYHLYSKDLPEKGIDGLGRPTLMHIAGGAAESGETVANQKTKDITMLDLTFPVYPEGPVSLYRAVRPEGDSLSVELTFMSCSDTLCNRPIEKAVVKVAVPEKADAKPGD